MDMMINNTISSAANANELMIDWGKIKRKITESEPERLGRIGEWDPKFTWTWNYKFYKIFVPSSIKDVQFYPPAVKMTFTDGTVTTSVAQGDDEYNPEQGMIMCILQYIFGNKTYNNMFRKWIKNDEDRKIAGEKEALAEKEAKEIKARQEAREAKRKAVRAAKRREEAIEIQKEAYLRAMKEASASADNKEV